LKEIQPFCLETLKYPSKPQTELITTDSELENAAATVNQKLCIVVEKAKKVEVRA
jgi:hypothetical protein